MEAWEKWWKMARGSLIAAQSLEQTDVRSSASRNYYAAYQAVTALLLYQKLIPPADREAWSHEATPDLVREIPSRILRNEACKDIALRLRAAYELRLVADYIGNADVEIAKLEVSLKGTRFIHKLVGDVLPQDKI